jgi:acyl carrier protein
LRNYSPEFLVLFSSVSALTGGVGQAGYTAGNAFLDAWAQTMLSAGSPYPVIAINWERWRRIGLARNVEDRHLRLSGTAMEGGLDLEEALEAVERVLAASPLPQIAVASVSPEHLIRRSRELKLSSLEGWQGSETLYPRPELDIAYAPPVDEFQSEVARIYSSVLGVSRIGILDSFTLLGGDSLSAIKIVSRLREAFHLEYTVRWLFEDLTPKAVAERVESLQAADSVFSSFAEGEEIEQGEI